MRVLEGLTHLTGDQRYREAAVATTRFNMSELMYEGMISWGGHMAYNATADEMIWAEDKGRLHELKFHLPHYSFMYEVNPEATVTLIETLWNNHVLDWNSLDFNRHGKPQPRGALWESTWNPIPVFFTVRG